MKLIKIGGGKTMNIDSIAQDIAALIKSGETCIVVHGASVTRDALAKQLGFPTATIVSPSGVSSVYTDEKAIDMFLMSYAGLVNKRIVAIFQKYGINAIGLSGIDGRLWEAKRKDVIYAVENGKTRLIKDSLTGKVEKINSGLINLLLHNTYVPVICPPAISFDNQIVNTDNDTAVAVMVGLLGIQEMIVLFEAAGMLKDINNPQSVIKKIKKEHLKDYMEYAVGRMKKKLLGAQKAFGNGLQTCYFGDGRIKHPILSVLNGKGTVIS